MPRFIIGVRELYHLDPRRGQGIDTGFGVFSQPTAGRSAAASATPVVGVVPGEADGDDTRQV